MSTQNTYQKYFFSDEGIFASMEPAKSKSDEFGGWSSRWPHSRSLWRVQMLWRGLSHQMNISRALNILKGEHYRWELPKYASSLCVPTFHVAVRKLYVPARRCCFAKFERSFNLFYPQASKHWNERRALVFWPESSVNLTSFDFFLWVLPNQRYMSRP